MRAEHGKRRMLVVVAGELQTASCDRSRWQTCPAVYATALQCYAHLPGHIVSRIDRDDLTSIERASQRQHLFRITPAQTLAEGDIDKIRIGDTPAHGVKGSGEVRRHDVARGTVKAA